MPAEIPTRPSDLLATADEAWNELSAALEARPSGPVHAEGDQRWTAAQVYAHVARWLELDITTLRAHIAGEPAPKSSDEDYLVTNARWGAEDERLGIAEGRARAQRAHDDFLSMLRSLPEERWDEKVRSTLTENYLGHVQQHVGFVQ